MKKFWSDFKKFISQGNIIQLAIAVVIGAAFGKIITSFVNDMIMPLISLVFIALGLKGIDAWKWEITDKSGEITATLNYGAFIQSIIDFFLIALCIFIFFRLLKRASDGVKKSEEKRKHKNGVPEPEPEPPKEPTTNELLTEIRDLLKAQEQITNKDETQINQKE